MHELKCWITWEMSSGQSSILSDEKKGNFAASSVLF